MKNRPDDLRTIRAIDDLVSGSPKRMFALSPNDALVQISLPLVLILAIITRLMVIGQALTAHERGPVILEMWKQQLILRMDNVMDRWERAVELPAFPEFSRINWDGSLPSDDRFRALCRGSQALNDWESHKTALYEQALQFRSDGDATGDDAARLLDLYDPRSSVKPEHPGMIPPEFVITEERRNYALAYIDDRMRQWKQKVEALQWAVVGECASRFPMGPSDDAAAPSAQMRRIATELDHQGYPLLDSILNEYAREP